jgi:hypothetical protein
MILSSFLIITILVSGWFMFIDGTLYNSPIELESNRLQTTKSIYVPGEMVQVTLRYLKNRTLLEQVTWSLKSNILIEFSPRVVGLPEGKQDFLMDIARIPINLPGIEENTQWKFTGYVEYTINPLRTILYAVETNEFTINNIRE